MSSLQYGNALIETCVHENGRVVVRSDSGMRVYMCVYVCMCLCVCMCVYVYIYIYI